MHGATPLHKAAAAHNLEMAAWLVARKAIVDARDAEGRTPLDYAVLTAGWSANDHYFPYLSNALVDPARFYEVVRLLRESGAELTRGQLSRLATARRYCECIATASSRTRLSSTAAGC